MLNFLKKLVCSHRNLSFYCNLYGDMIFLSGGKRSLWKCDDCGTLVANKNLFVALEQ